MTPRISYSLDGGLSASIDLACALVVVVGLAVGF